MKILGIHLGHHSHYCLVEDGKVKSVFELERFFRCKAYKVHAYTLKPEKIISTYQYIHIDDLKKTLNLCLSLWGKNYDYIAVECAGRRQELENLKIVLNEFNVKYNDIELINHHLSHACGSFFTSKFKKSLILSYDGEGNDGKTILFSGEGSKVTYLKKLDIQMGHAYNNIGYILNIKPEITGESAGKSMGLAGYGTLHKEWIPYIRKYIFNYKRRKRDPVQGPSRFGQGHKINSIFIEKIKELKPYRIKAPLCVDISYSISNKLHLNRLNRYLMNRKGYIKLDSPSNQLSQDLMRTFQKVWTDIVLEILNDYPNKYENLCVTGGCALNGITNFELIKQWGWDHVHFIPNPSDCGLAIGAALKVYWDKCGNEFEGYNEYLDPYIGMELFDKEQFEKYKIVFPNRKISNEKYLSIIAKMIYEGKILGLIQGRCEIGPRALGNRSILCNPLIENMKDILNNKIKHREWFRPFAPVCTYDDRLKYFTCEGEINYMSIVCYTKDDYRYKLPSITHIDRTARLQTVKREQNPFLYDLIKVFEKYSGYPILLNTSLNPRGEPILNFLKVALEMLENTELDFIVYNYHIFGKPEKLKYIDDSLKNLNLFTNSL